MARFSSVKKKSRGKEMKIGVIPQEMRRRVLISATTVQATSALFAREQN